MMTYILTFRKRPESELQVDRGGGEEGRDVWGRVLGELRCRFPYAYCAVTSNLCHLPGDVSYSTVTFKSFSTLSFWLGVNRSSEQQITREIKEFYPLFPPPPSFQARMCSSIFPEIASKRKRLDDG